LWVPTDSWVMTNDIKKKKKKNIHFVILRDIV